ELLREAADRYGAQCVVLSVDARRCQDGAVTDSGFEVTTHGGRRGTGIDAVEWAHRGAELGAGEILLNAMDAAGTKDGYDLELVRLVRAIVDVPLIASGGPGQAGNFAPAVGAGPGDLGATVDPHQDLARIAEDGARRRPLLQGDLAAVGVAGDDADRRLLHESLRELPGPLPEQLGEVVAQHARRPLGLGAADVL